MSLKNFETLGEKKIEIEIAMNYKPCSINANSAFCCLPVLHFFLII